MPQTRVLPRFCFCASVGVSVTFDTGFLMRLSNHVVRTVTLATGAMLMPGFAAHQTLGAELIVGPRCHRADRELTIELGQRRRAEPGVDRAPSGNSIGDVIKRRDARADDGVSLFGDGRSIVRRRQPGRDRRFEVVSVVVPPMIGARAQRHHQLRRRREDVLRERTQTLLRSARDAIHRQRRRLRDADDRGRRRGDVAVFLAVAVHPSPVGAGAERVRRCRSPSVHCTMPPTPLVGTC